MRDVNKIKTFEQALNNAVEMMEMTEIEPRSALKQAASDLGIPYGDEMGEFVNWAERSLLGDPKPNF